MDLGVLTHAAAVQGVEVSATIATSHSVTFQFQPETAGNYELLVLHEGKGLTLDEKGPSGTTSINPGSEGSFEKLILPLEKGTYGITASATDGSPVFVDWELLLVSGSGQAPAASTSLVSASAAVPLAGPSGSSGLAVPSATSGSNSASVAAPAVAPVSVAAPVSTVSGTVHGGLVGRGEADRPISPVGPTTQGGAYSVAFEGAGLPQGLIEVETVALPKTPMSVELFSGSRESQGDLALIESIQTSEPWWGRIALSMFPEGSKEETVAREVGEPTILANVEAPDAPSESHVQGDALPGMAVGIVTAVVIARRKMANSSQKTSQKKKSLFLSPSEWPRSFGRGKIA